MSFSLNSPAKINVFLEVLGKRPDGFHELETVMLRTNLVDEIHFDEASELSLSLSDGSMTSPNQFPLDGSNLIMKAAKALNQASGIELGARITVTKRIPAEAGLAGGSSNAATTLLGLNRLWGLSFSSEQLHWIAATLGSDINFFVEECSAAVCTGRGENVTPVASQRICCVAFRPMAGNSTPAVFQRIDNSHRPASSVEILEALASGDLQRIESCCRNRLTDSARVLNPEMAEMMDRVERVLTRPAFMSGSGSTCFVFAESFREASQLKSIIQTMGSRLSFCELLVCE